MGRVSWPDKYPDEEITGSVNWSHRLDTGVTITAKSFELLTGDVTLGTEGVSGVTTFVKVTGGTGADIAEVLCKVTLSNGDKWEDVAEFRMLEYPV